MSVFRNPAQTALGVGRDAALLLGYRRTFADRLFLEAELDITVHSGAPRWDFYQTGWSFGGELKTSLGADLALRDELRLTRYEKHRWGQDLTDIANVFWLDMRETELAPALIQRL